MGLAEIQMTIDDLVGVEPKSIGTDRDASEAAQWVDLEKKTEIEADALLDPAIKEAFSQHRKLTGQKKTLLEKLSSAKDRVRVNLANWIAGGHDVKGCYIKKKYRVTVVDQMLVPDEYLISTPDVKRIEEWVNTTEGQIAIPGVAIEQVNILYSREVE